MNDSDIHSWNRRAWLLLEELPGGVAAPLREQWKEFVRHTKPVVTLFGPYDSGKSSLLKRLLLDESLAVPDWLTISSRRETFDANEVEVCGVVMRDTPGISGGNEDHEAVTEAALLCTDALVVMLLPQLVTGDAQAAAAITGVLDGSRYHCGAESAFAPGSVLLVIARMDEAGAMPDVDLPSYQALVLRKREELSQFLSRVKVPEARLVVHALVADWSGEAGRDPNATASLYDGSRAWDGVAEFAAAIRALSGRREELRRRAERRFLRAHFARVREALEISSKEAMFAFESASNERESITLQFSRLEALLGNAKADLHHRVATEVEAICQRGDANPGTVKRLLSERLKGSIERWWEAQDAAVSRLAEEFDAEIEARHARPNWQAMAATLEGFATEEGEDGAAIVRAFGRGGEVSRIAKALQKAYFEAAPFILDMPLSQAREELGRLRQAASFQEYARQSARQRNAFRDPSHAERAAQMVKFEVAVMAAVPVIVELASIVIEQQAEARAAEERVARRAQLHARIEQAAESIISQTWEQWHDEGMAAVFSSALKVFLKETDARVSLFQQQMESVNEAMRRVGSLLEEHQ